MSNLVICCDGTWNSADQAADPKTGELCVTNVLKVAVRLKQRTAAGTLQIVYYDQGVGTGNFVDRIQGGVAGEGLEANINDAYRFLLANYLPGDRIYIFGFSRGAYTARSIAGMIRRCGILQRKHVDQYPKAKALYMSGAPADGPDATKFRNDYCIPEAATYCVGVWDTVGALGIPLRAFAGANQRKYQFLDTSLSRTVKFAFHALAVDEHRGPFKPTLWDNEPAPGQVVQQAWFAGAHSDVGGGYPDHRLSDVALVWMIQCAKTAGLEFDDDVIQTLGPATLDVTQKPHDSKSALYTFSGIDREIGATKYGTEYFHQSLVDKWHKGNDDGSKYRPKPLEKYAKRLDALPVDGGGGVLYPVAG